MSVPPRIVLVLLAVTGLVLLAEPAAAQSEAELRRENEKLKSQVRDLEAELAAARARITDLEQRIAEFEKALQGGAGRGPATPPPPAPKITIDESDPAASPRAMLRSLQGDYAEATKDLELDTSDERRARAYLRQVRGWAQKTNRQKTPIDWHVTVEPVADGYGRPAGVEFTPVDPVSGAVLGAPFRGDVSRTLGRRLEEIMGRGHETLILKGVLEPRVIVNPRRLEKGPFDNPPFIGPFAEFDYAVDVRAIDVPEG